MLKRLLCLLLVLMMVPTTLALATETVLVDEKDRKIELNGRQADGNFPTNMVLLGESPTTGLPWEGDYMPMLVQIDNTDGGVDKIAPWGARYADIVYETPLYSVGSTRISFLFSDHVPDSAGPVRSARVGHVWLREEWDAGFLYYGGQEAEGSNINKEFSKYKATKKGVLFSGIVSTSKPWKKYYTRVKGLSNPHNVDANVAAMRDLIPETHVAPDRPYLFTDVLPTTGEAATSITLGWKHKDYVSTFTYDADKNCYTRTVHGVPYVDSQTGEQLEFANLIVQRTKVRYYGGHSDRPILSNVGQGNADIFMGGRYIAGYWIRTAMDQRTIFFDENGNELELQRGKTYIAMPDSNVPVTYSAD